MKPSLHKVLTLSAAIVAVSLAARVNVAIPGSPVPQSLQTLAVCVVGMWLGPARGALALALYVAIGAAGAPVFADGAGGLQHLVGPTGGYLVGFLVGAAAMGWWTRQNWGRGFVSVGAGSVAAHVVILGLGWARLAVLIGGVAAFSSGVLPFLVGGLVKSLGAAALWVAIPRPEPVEPVTDTN
jgi:biotin transport system substrate-specific component